MNYTKDLEAVKRAEIIRVLKRAVKLLETDAFLDSEFDKSDESSRVYSYLERKLEQVKFIIDK